MASANLESVRSASCMPHWCGTIAWPSYLQWAVVQWALPHWTILTMGCKAPPWPPLYGPYVEAKWLGEAEYAYGMLVRFGRVRCQIMGWTVNFLQRSMTPCSFSPFPFLNVGFFCKKISCLNCRWRIIIKSGSKFEYHDKIHVMLIIPHWDAFNTRSPWQDSSTILVIMVG